MDWVFKIMFIFLTCFSVTTISGQSIFYVSEGSTGDGSNWLNASGSLQDVLEEATSGDQVWVAQGTYKPTTCGSCTPGNRSISFEIPAGVKVYGGFLEGQTAINERTEGTVSVLSGDIDGNNSRSNNSYNIVYIKNATNETLIDGFTIQDAYAEISNVAAGSYSNSGGGIYIEKDRKDEPTGPTISNCRFKDNEVFGIGAGVFIDADQGWISTTIENCIFEDNLAQNGGAAIQVKSDFGGISALEVINSTFDGNTTSERGGALYNNSFRGQSDISLINCSFDQNEATKEGGAIGIDVEQGEGTLFIDRSEIKNNDGSDGGAIYLDAKNGTYDLKILNTEIDSNLAQFNGGGLYVLGTDSANVELEIAYTTFLKNTVSGNGGAIYVNATDNKVFKEYLLGVKFHNNKANGNGGAISWLADNGQLNGTLLNVSFANNESFSGGGIFLNTINEGNGFHKLINTTFFANSGFYGGALTLNNDDGTGNANLFVTNSLFKSNTGLLGSQVARLANANPTFHNSILDVADCDASYSVPTGLTGNVICQALIFESVELEDESMLDLSPVIGSSAIDKSDNTAIDTFEIESDADSTYRFDNLIADLGAFESRADILHDVQWDVFPMDTLNCDSIDTRLRVVARGNGHFEYQWLKDGNPIENAENRIIELDGDVSISGYYQLRVIDENDQTFISDSIRVQVMALDDFSVTATADNLDICQLDSIELTGLIEGPESDYQPTWYRNGVPFSDTLSVFASGLEPNDNLQLVVTSSSKCLMNAADSSELIQPTVQIPNLPTVQIGEPGRICANDSKRLGVIATFEGANPEYTWYRNGLKQVGSGSQKEFINLKNTDEIYVELASSEACISQPVVASEVIRPNVVSLTVPELSIQTTDSLICQGQRASFFANISNAGTAPTIMWYANADLIAENVQEISLTDFENGDTVYVEVLPDGECIESTPYLSNKITMEVRPIQAPSLELTADKTVLCAGQSVSASVTIENEPFLYDLYWSLNGEVIATDTNAVVIPTIENGDRLVSSIEFSSICAANGVFESNIITFDVSDSSTVDLNIEASSNPICEGEQVQLTARFSDGVLAENVDWFINGSLIEDKSGAQIIVSYLEDGDEVMAKSPTPGLCAAEDSVSSNTILFSISNAVPIQLGIPRGSFSICRKDNFFLSTNSVNLGINKRIDWYVNDVKRATGDTLFFEGISADASVYAIGYPSISCPAQDSIISETIEIEALDDIEAVANLVFDANEYCKDNVRRLKLETEPTNGGKNPTYKWFLNGNFTFISADIFRLRNFVPTDRIHVEMTSNNACVNPSNRIVNSDTLTILDINCELVLPTEQQIDSDQLVRLYPNPSRGLVQMEFKETINNPTFRLHNSSGQLIWTETLAGSNTNWNFDLNNQLNGVYFLSFQSAEYTGSYKVIFVQ